MLKHLIPKFDFFHPNFFFFFKNIPGENENVNVNIVKENVYVMIVKENVNVIFV